MKKQLLLTLIIISSVFSAKAQKYDVTATTGSYADLQGSTVLSPATWDDWDTTIYMGFSFTLFDSLAYDSIRINANGNTGFGKDNSFSPGYRYLITPYGSDLIYRASGTSPISYKAEGSAPVRIFKVEWKNAGFQQEEANLGTKNDSTNFQLWLYEGSNDIEFRMGPNLITDPAVNFYGDSGPGSYLQDFSPEASGNNAIIISAGLTGVPANGAIYKFTKAQGPTSIPEQRPADFAVYPNPSIGIFSILTEKQGTKQVNIFNTTGQFVFSAHDIKSEIKVDISHLPRGFYLLQVTDDKGPHTVKLLKN